MKKSLLGIAILVGSALAGEHGVHWGYSGHGGPEHWGELSKKFEMCAIGRNQSPIDIDSAKAYATKLPPIVFNYTKSGTTNVVDNGHTEQVNVAEGDSIRIDGIDFVLKQFHFHAPSENTIDGKHFPMEAHFVHADAKGNLAVVALMFNEGAENPVLKKIWERLPEKAVETHDLVLSGKEVDALLPKDRSYYRFNGSLTTPPCSEGVRWMVLKTPVTASKAQIEKFRSIMHHPNNRPVQPLNARIVVQ